MPIFFKLKALTLYFILKMLAIVFTIIALKRVGRFELLVVGRNHALITGGKYINYKLLTLIAMNFSLLSIVKYVILAS